MRRMTLRGAVTAPVRAFVIVAAASTALVAPVLALEANETPNAKNVAAITQPIERASADDCAIIVEVGKAKMNWGTAPPQYDFFPEFDRAGGGTYLQDCPWRELGVAEPLIGTPASQRGFFITRPVYIGVRASVDLQSMVRSNEVVNGKSIAPFIKLESCALEKQDGRWRLVECTLKRIT